MSSVKVEKTIKTDNGDIIEIYRPTGEDGDIYMGRSNALVSRRLVITADKLRTVVSGSTDTVTVELRLSEDDRYLLKEEL